MSTLKAVDLQHPSAAAANISLASSGNVGIGTSSPTRPLEISAASASASITSTTGTNAVNFNFNNTGGLFAVGIDNSTGTGFGAGAYGRVLYSDGAYPLVMYTNATERMRIDSSGNVGVGTSSVFSGARLDIVGSGTQRLYIRETGSSVYGKIVASTTVVGIGSETNHPLLFNTNDVERARIDTSGNLLVGTTSGSATSGIGVKVNTSATAPYVATVGSDTTSSNGAYYLYSTGAAAYRFYVGYNGTVFATSTTISGISDQRLKENVRDLDVGIDAIMALKPRKFDWKAGKGKDIKDDRGFIAQEFEQVFPDLVDAWKDPAPEGEEPYKSVRADLIPILVKAIQEQQATITALKARVATLEAK